MENVIAFGDPSFCRCTETEPGFEARASVTRTGVSGVGGAAVGPAVMMISVVATLNACSFPVDKGQPKAGARQQQVPQPKQRSGPPDVVPASVAEGGRKEQSAPQLGGLQATSNRRFQAVAIVLQQTLAEVWKSELWRKVFLFYFCVQLLQLSSSQYCIQRKIERSKWQRLCVLTSVSNCWLVKV